MIKVEGLTKKFKDFIAVDNISFNVKEGEIFGFLGPNGAGKSTTIKMITTLLKPDQGKIKLNGYDPAKNKYEVRKSFGIVFQDQSIDNELTAYENMEFHGVLYGLEKENRKERIKELLDIVGLWGRRNDFVKKFSGGMRRRLEIARGLMHHPKIIFLDEPTLGLDSQTRGQIWGYIKDLNKNKNVTIFFTTHYLDEVEKVANKIAIIDSGKIVAEGSPSELQTKTGTNSLEEAYLFLTGKEVRDSGAGALDNLRLSRKSWKS